MPTWRIFLLTNSRAASVLRIIIGFATSVSLRRYSEFLSTSHTRPPPYHVFGDSATSISPLPISKIRNHFLGASIWERQTRFDLCYLACRMATYLGAAAKDANALADFATTAQQFRKTMMPFGITIRYEPFAHPNRLSQLSAFSYDGEGALFGSSSTESRIVGWGMPLSRDGDIVRGRHPIFWKLWKLNRIIRASMTCAVFSICTASDICIWSQSFYFDSIFGEFDGAPFQSTADASMVTPLKTRRFTPSIRVIIRSAAVLSRPWSPTVRNLVAIGGLRRRHPPS